jgi:hypothetical protein
MQRSAFIDVPKTDELTIHYVNYNEVFDITPRFDLCPQWYDHRDAHSGWHPTGARRPIGERDVQVYTQPARLLRCTTLQRWWRQVLVQQQNWSLQYYTRYHAWPTCTGRLPTLLVQHMIKGTEDTRVFDCNASWIVSASPPRNTLFIFKFSKISGM